MKNTNITKIRQLLNDRIAVAKVSADNENYLIMFSIKDAEEILALLPCETCNGSGRLAKYSRAGDLVVGDPCPDCQKPKRKCKNNKVCTRYMDGTCLDCPDYK